MNLKYTKICVLILFNWLFDIPILYYLYDAELFNIHLITHMSIRTEIILFIICFDLLQCKKNIYKLLERGDLFVICFIFIYAKIYNIPILKTGVWNIAHWIVTWPIIDYE